MSIIHHRPTTHEADNCGIEDASPQLFLAGPILGARDWQKVATTALPRLLPPDMDVHVSNPRWDTVPLNEKLDKDSQRTWEKRHYRAALAAGEWGARGVMLFYLIHEEPLRAVTPNPPLRSYAQGTGHEFSEAAAAEFFTPYDVDIVLGMHPQFVAAGKGLHEYRHTAAELGLEIHTGLMPTLRAAAELLMQPADVPPTHHPNSVVY